LTNFTYETLGEGATGVLAVSGTDGTINPSTGRITSTAATFTAAGTSHVARLDGQLHGEMAQSLSGIFATTNADGVKYVGGFASGRGPSEEVVSVIEEFDDETGLGRSSSVTFDGVESASLVFVAKDMDAIYSEANHPSATIRTGAFMANLAPAFQGAITSAGNVRHRSGTLDYKGQPISVTKYDVVDGLARLLVFDASANSHTDSVIVAGGTAYTAGIFGGYTYEGTHIFAERDGLAQTRRGTFELKVQFGTREMLYRTTNALPSSATLYALGTGLDSQTGRFTDTSASFDSGSGLVQTARIDGLVHGDKGLAVSGVFATTDEAAMQYAGGFVGRGPQIVVRIDGLTTTRGVGASTRLPAFNRDAVQGRTLVVLDRYDHFVRDQMNSPRNNARRNAPLFQLDYITDMMGGYLTNSNRSIYSNTGEIDPRNNYIFSDFTSYQQHSNKAWFAMYGGEGGLAYDEITIASGVALSGTPSGEYLWEGVYRFEGEVRLCANDGKFHRSQWNFRL